MASQLGIAPMTVSQVYKELKAVGLLETKPGHGTFVSTSVLAQVRPHVLELQPRIDALLDEATAAGLERRRLGGAGQCPDQSPQRAPCAGLRLVFVGIFEEATRAYGADIQAHLPAGDTIQTTTLEAIGDNELARKRALNADLVLTLANRKADVLEILGPKKRVMGVSYIPSERTRTLLAQIDPLARVAIVSTFPEFLPIMKAGVQRFAPHVHDIRATVLESGDLAQVLQGADVVVRASGSERVATMLAAETPSFEYRHTPDPREIDQILLPLLEDIRGRLAPPASPEPTGAPAAPMRRSHEN